MWGMTVRPKLSPPRPHHKGEGAVSRAEDDMLEGQGCS